MADFSPHTTNSYRHPGVRNISVTLSNPPLQAPLEDIIEDIFRLLKPVPQLVHLSQRLHPELLLGVALSTFWCPHGIRYFVVPHFQA